MTTNKTVDSLQNYLEKHPPQFTIAESPDKSVGIIIVIPAYREERLLFRTLDSLINCYSPSCSVEIIVVFNASDADSPSIVEEQKATFNKLSSYIQKDLSPGVKIHGLEAYNLRKKYFGAGWARKIGLDEAVKRFHHLNMPDGVLVCLDADSPVAPDYLKAIEAWAEDPAKMGAVIHFEHPLEGNNEPLEAYKGIVLYELHLRYYLRALRSTGYPYAYHTMGSCMVFRAVNYAKAGGMPRKQAGEDFYFLQKLIPLGGFGEIKNTTVYPSPRSSSRVIFGTGASIKQHLEGVGNLTTTYNPQAFEDLKQFFSQASGLFNIPIGEFENWTYNLTGPLRSFLLNSGFQNELDGIKQNSSNEKTFSKRFFGVFNTFKVIKYLNYAHEHFYSRTDVFDAAFLILEQSSVEDLSEILDERELLLKYRNVERSE